MKKPFPVSLDESTIKWINTEIKKGKFRNKSHMVEEAIMEFKRKIEEGSE